MSLFRRKPKPEPAPPEPKPALKWKGGGGPIEGNILYYALYERCRDLDLVMNWVRMNGGQLIPDADADLQDALVDFDNYLLELGLDVTIQEQ